MNIPLKLALICSGRPSYLIAASAGLSESRLSRIVKGRLDPTDAELTRLAKALGVPVTSIMATGHACPQSVDEIGNGRGAL